MEGELDKINELNVKRMKKTLISLDTLLFSQLTYDRYNIAV